MVAGLIVAAVLVAGGIWAFSQFGQESTGAGDTEAIRLAFKSGLYANVIELAENAWESEQANTVAIMAAESAAKLQKPDIAMEWYRRLTDDGSTEYANAIAASGMLCWQTGHLAESEAAFKEALKRNPESAESNRQLATLLVTEGRRWEASKYLFETVRADVQAEEASLDDLLMLANFEAPFQDLPTIRAAIQAVPEDLFPVLGRVHTTYVLDQFSEGIELSKQVVAAHPDHVPGHIWLARGLIGSARMDQIPAWNATLPKAADTFPGVWHIRGLWASANGQNKAAARCFWEAVKREPNYMAGNYQLGLALVELGQKDRGQPFLKRNSMLSDYHQTTHPLYGNGANTESLLKLVALSEQLGRLWEQVAWAQILIKHCMDTGNKAELANGRELYKTVSASIKDASPERTLKSASPANSLDLSDYPLPDWSQARETTAVDQASQTASTIRFEDIAADVGLDFTYFKGTGPETKGIQIFQTTGGGVASIDYDRDGWNDLYFTQGNVWPVPSDGTGPQDKFFRNVAGQSVVDITTVAGFSGVDYSQGVNVGDINDDGFPDLYVGNNGQNRLFSNNGDGTFSETNNSIDVRPAVWTTSVAIADLNGDGWADLYDVNYLSGDDVYTRLCGDDVPRACGPSEFEGEHDDVYFSNGDGTFTNATAKTGLGKLKGKGLGIVVADFEGSGQLTTFIANDGTANYYLVPKGENQDLKIQDLALERGLAFDFDSRGQACMGVAAGDYNGDAALDLFVTNYYGDSNTLYSMLSSGAFFEDRARETRLRTPSFQFVGFGTQFLDADLDGWSDLVLTNGHVDDFSHKDIPFRMRPQFYKNLGGTFTEVLTDEDAKFMNQQQLGRGLSRLDFDRDGRDDFVVSHLDTPAALARNVTPDAGHYLTLSLIGVDITRDAIGTSVTVKTNDRSSTLQLTAGDGYQAANARTLNFGLGKSTTIEQLTVKWPSGETQTFTNITADAEIAIRQGDPRPFVLGQ